MNKDNDTERQLLDVTCEQVGSHVLFRGVISFCADASTAMMIGQDDRDIVGTLSSMGIDAVRHVDSGDKIDFIVCSDVLRTEAALDATLARMAQTWPANQFTFLYLADEIARAAVVRLLAARDLALLRYRSVKGGVAAVWIGPQIEKRVNKDGVIGARIMVLSDRPDATLTRIRLGVPLQFLADELNLKLVFRPFALFHVSDLSEADFFIAQRGAHRRASSILHIIKQAASAYVYEIDDLLTEIPEFLAHHGGLIENKSIILDLISQAALVTCTQENLRQKMLRLNNQVKICGNYADPYLLPKFQARQDAENNATVTIMIAASDRILVHFLMDALMAVLRTYPDRVKLVVVGPIGEDFRKKGIEAHYVDVISHADFTKFAAALINPIGVIPLDDSEFSSCKSAVKFFDYSVAGLATVCSNVSPYREVIDNHVNGILVENTTDAWFQALEKLVIDGAWRARIACKAAQQARKLHGMDVVTRQWYDVIEAMLLQVRTATPARTGIEKLKFKWLCFSLALRSMNHQRIEMRRAAKTNSRNAT